jgi:hypothetical protein
VQRLCKECRGREPLRGSALTKLRRNSAFAHRVIAARSAEVGETFQGFTVPKLRRRSIPRTQVRPRLQARKRKQRLRPLILQKSSKEKEEAEAQEGATTTIGSVLEERSGSLKFTSRCRQESTVEEKEIWAVRSCTDSRQPSDPEKVAQSLISGRVHR